MVLTVQTKKNLEFAFAGESRAVRRYSLFANVAKREGFKNLAKLFNKIALQEIGHANSHYQALGTVKTSEENLGLAIQSEHYEIEEMYPNFIDQCKDSEIKAKESFEVALKQEYNHEKIFKKALEFIKKGKDVPDSMLDNV